MKKISYTLALLLTASITFSSCNTGGADSVDINGIRWATRNVNTPGTFVRNPRNAGGFFTWEEAQNACPQGWRLPTQQELQSLMGADRGWIIRDDVNGRLFGSDDNQIFLPAAGWRNTGNGALDLVGYWGYYWSSTAWSANNTWCLWFSSDSSGVDFNYRADGFSVRCVAK